MIEARADEPHHPDLEALLSPPPHNYTCIIRTHTPTLTQTHTHLCMCTHIHIMETVHSTPDESPSHIPTNLRASESPWSSSSVSMHRDIITRGVDIVLWRWFLFSQQCSVFVYRIFFLFVHVVLSVSPSLTFCLCVSLSPV